MKILPLLFLLTASPSHAQSQTQIIRLLDCQLEGAPIPHASLYSYQGALWLITTDREGEIRRVQVPEGNWERRLLYLSDNPALRGVIFYRDRQWHYTFKGEGGWYMAGQAHCQE